MTPACWAATTAMLQSSPFLVQRAPGGRQTLSTFNPFDTLRGPTTNRSRSTRPVLDRNDQGFHDEQERFTRTLLVYRNASLVQEEVTSTETTLGANPSVETVFVSEVDRDGRAQRGFDPVDFSVQDKDGIVKVRVPRFNAKQARMRLSYNTPNVQWTPSYSIVYDSEEGSVINLSRIATVCNANDEDFADYSVFVVSGIQKMPLQQYASATNGGKEDMMMVASTARSHSRSATLMPSAVGTTYNDGNYAEHPWRGPALAKGSTRALLDSDTTLTAGAYPKTYFVGVGTGDDRKDVSFGLELHTKGGSIGDIDAGPALFYTPDLTLIGGSDLPYVAEGDTAWVKLGVPRDIVVRTMTHDVMLRQVAHNHDTVTTRHALLVFVSVDGDSTKTAPLVLTMWSTPSSVFTAMPSFNVKDRQRFWRFRNAFTLPHIDLPPDVLQALRNNSDDDQDNDDQETDDEDIGTKTTLSAALGIPPRPTVLIIYDKVTQIPHQQLSSFRLESEYTKDQ